MEKVMEFEVLKRAQTMLFYILNLLLFCLLFSVFFLQCMVDNNLLSSILRLFEF